MRADWGEVHDSTAVILSGRGSVGRQTEPDCGTSGSLSSTRLRPFMSGRSPPADSWCGPPISEKMSRQVLSFLKNAARLSGPSGLLSTCGRPTRPRSGSAWLWVRVAWLLGDACKIIPASQCHLKQFTRAPLCCTVDKCLRDLFTSVCCRWNSHSSRWMLV